jgi:hypothetical protein
MKRLLWALRIYAIALLSLHLVAPWLPEEIAWGIWPYSLLPLAVRYGGVLVAFLLLWPPVTDRLEAFLPSLIRRTGLHRLRASGEGLGRTASCLALALFSAVPFWWGRIVHTRWGDAYILTKAIPHPDVRLTYTWQAPLDLFIHAKLWAAANSLWGWDVMRLYNVTSVLAGVAFVYLVCRAASDLGRTPAERWLMGGAILSLGMMQLFFGYVENYTLIPLGILGFLWLGLRVLQGRSPIWLASLVLAVTNALHPSTIVLWPAALVVVVAVGAGERVAEKPTWRRWGEFVVPPLLVAGVLLLFMEQGGHGISALLGADFPGGGDRRWVVPLWETETKWEHYTMFSMGHLLDILNEQLLVAPFSLALLVLTALFLPRRRGEVGHEGFFLAVAGLGYLALTLIWNPDYGGRRDWDLFAPVALPLTVWAIYTLSQRVIDGRFLRRVAWIVVPTSFLHLLGWVYSNTLPWSW